MKKALLLAAILATAPVHAQQTSADHAAHHPAPAAASPAEGAMSEGEVRKVDLDAKKITLRHGPIPNLDMPPMTMEFEVDDRAPLQTLKAGERIRFLVEQRNGKMVITRIEPAR